jgi:serine protease Do
MNSPILWWAARPTRAVPFTPFKPTFLPALSQRLARMATTAAIALGMCPLAMVPVRAEVTASASQSGSAPQILVDSTPLVRGAGMISSFAPIVDKVGPSIVTIYTTKTVKDSPGGDQVNPMLRRFFGLPDNPGGDEGGGKVEGLGSGVIVSPDGLILTNNHVAEAGDDIKVRIGEHGHEYTAKVVGNDPTSDLALLRIDAKNLPVITFADSEQIKVGDVVLAVGNPFGFTNTVTMGIVSGLGRAGVEDSADRHEYEDFIQTDAPINPGNSGGALVDTEGRLIGINTAIYSRSGGNQGIGFAVPSNLARNVIDSLLKNGKVVRGYLGTGVQGLTPDLADQFNVPADQQGALITAVTPGSAAEAAGLQNGDIIVAVDGKQIADPHALRLTVGGMNPGDKVQVQYLRNGQQKSVSVTLGAEPTSDQLADNTAQSNDHPNVLDGITVVDLDGDARSEFKIPKNVKGVLIADVTAGSVAADAGLQKGDVILEMNHIVLTAAQQAVDEGNKIAQNEKVLLQVWSNGMTEFLVLKPKV